MMWDESTVFPGEQGMLTVGTDVATGEHDDLESAYARVACHDWRG